MKKILFPTDFSEVANNAFIHALEFAKIVNGELVLLHTFELVQLQHVSFHQLLITIMYSWSHVCSGVAVLYLSVSIDKLYCNDCVTET